MSLKDHLLRNRRGLRKRATRQTILDAGRDAFSELGFDACTVRDIIRRTDLASGTFYNYFDTKEAVLQEIVGDEIQQLTKRMQASRRGAVDLYHFVLSAYRDVFHSVVSNPDVYRIMLRNEAAVRQMYAETGFGNSLNALKADMHDAVSRGVLPDINVDWLAGVFFGAGYEVGRSLISEEAGPTEAEAAAEFTARLFLGGIQAFSCQGPGAMKLRMRPRNPA